MNYDGRTRAKYKKLHDTFYSAAYEEAHVGRTTEYEAKLQAEDVAHYLTQRHLCQTDLYYLAWEMFGMRDAVSKQMGTRGRKIWHPPIHGEMCDEIQGPWDSLLMFSRNMLKTTVAKIWCVQQILRDPTNVRIGMWSRTAGKVQTELKSIKGMLKNPRLLELFDDRLIKDDRKWEICNREALCVTRKVGDEPERLIPVDEAQIEVWGLESGVTGRHYTHHYYDDIIDRDNTTTATQIDKARDQWAAIQGLKSVDTIEKIIGTRWHQLDLYATIEAESLIPEEHRKVRPGVTVDGRILYPYYTKEWLAGQKRRMGEYLYGCQYPLDTRPKSHRMFILPVPHWSKETFPEDPKFYIAVDPSTGKSEKHDKTGIAVGCVSKSAPHAVYYVEAESYTWKPEQIADELVDRIIKYNPEKVGIEYGLQEALRPLIQMKIREKKQLVSFREPVWVEIKTGGGRGASNKADKIDRTLGAMVRDQRAFFDPGMNRCFEQMATFNPNVQKNEDDILDACSMLIQTIEHFMQAHWFGSEEFTPTGINIDFFRRKRAKTLRDRLWVA